MARSLLLSVLALIVLAAGSYAADAYTFKDGKIIASPCVMSYTDSRGGDIRVIRSNSLTIVIR